MKNLVKGMITNRFGIVLATLNLCYFLSGSYIHNGFAYTGLDKIMILTNSPGIVLAIISSRFAEFLFQGVRTHGGARFSIVLMIFFVTLQWLFIGWAAKAIARRFQPKLS